MLLRHRICRISLTGDYPNVVAFEVDAANLYRPTDGLSVNHGRQAYWQRGAIPAASKRNAESVWKLSYTRGCSTEGTRHFKQTGRLAYTIHRDAGRGVIAGSRKERQAQSVTK